MPSRAELSTAAPLPRSVPHPDATQPRRGAGRDLLFVAALATVVVLLACAVAWPWLPDVWSAKAGHRFQPYANGQATTRVSVDANGAPLAWATDNITIFAAWQVFDDTLPQSLRDQVLRLVPSLLERGEFPPGTSLLKNHTHVANADGTGSDSVTYLLRRADADLVLAVELPGIAMPLLYDPPPNLAVDDALPAPNEQSGTFAGIYTYTLSSNQSAQPSVTTPLGNWQDCRRVTTVFDIFTTSGLLAHESSTSDFCAGAGMVAQTLDNGSAITVTSFMLPGTAANSLVDIHGVGVPGVNERGLLPPAQPLPLDRWTGGDISTWAVSTITATLPGRGQRATIAPIYMDTQPPLLLTAARNGPLIAHDAQPPTAPRWAMQTAGSIYSPPAVDPATGYLYFGSSDKNVHALSSNGIALWRGTTTDNVAARPLIVQDTVIFVAEDGHVRAFDKFTGSPRWQLALGALAIASPAALTTPEGEIAIFGNDDGALLAVAADSGNVVWESAVDGAVHAPITTADGVVYVASDRAVFAFDALGSPLWRAPILTPPQSALAMADDTLYLVDTQGWVYALARANGQLRWRSSRAAYLGPPILVNDTGNNGSADQVRVLVASPDGTFTAFFPAGAIMEQWPAALSSVSPVSISPGPTAGGDAIWMAADNGTVLRLGAPLSEPGDSP